MSSSESLADQERQWVEVNRAVLDHALTAFMKTGEWPKVPDLHRYFAQSWQDLDVQAVADSKPEVPGETRQVYQGYVSVALRHLRYMPAAASLVNICLAVARRAAEIYRTPEVDMKVASSDPAIHLLAEGNMRLLQRAGAILHAEQPSPIAGGGPLEDGWEYFINQPHALTFENVTSADEFVCRQNAILKSRYDQRQQLGQIAASSVSFGRPMGVGVAEAFLAPVGATAGVTDELREHPRAFISHASEDKERFVTEFATRLRANGIDAWVDQWELAAGDSLVRRIFQQGIGEADAFVIVLSTNSITKPWVERELNTGVVSNIGGGCRLIPVVLDGVEPPVVLKDTLWVRINNLAAYDEQLQNVVRGIFGVRDAPPLGPVPGYVARPANIRGLNSRDGQVLAALARTAVESRLGCPNYEAALAECVDAGLDEAAFSVSLEALGKACLIEYDRPVDSFVTDLRMTQAGFIRYLEVRPDLPQLRRRLVALLVNELQEGEADLATLALRLKEPEEIVRVLLTELENRRLLTLVRTLGSTDVMSVSTSLERELD